jgi:hypothetical protein
MNNIESRKGEINHMCKICTYEKTLFIDDYDAMNCEF